MEIFDIDEQMIMNAITSSLEEAAYNASEEQFINIANKIDEKFGSMLDLVGRMISESWKAEARKAGGWGTKYAEAVTYKVEGEQGEVYLDEQKIDPESDKPFYMFAMMMENGVKSWSIKKALLASEKAKIGPSGIKYIRVPFNIATPRRKDQGKMQSRFGKREMSRKIYDLVRGGGTLKSGTLNVQGKEIDISGLSRYTNKKYHTGYGIFRTVSERSKGWQFPGVGKTPVLNSVKQQVNRDIHDAVMEFCSNVTKEFTT